MNGTFCGKRPAQGSDSRSAFQRRAQAHTTPTQQLTQDQNPGGNYRRGAENSASRRKKYADLESRAH